MKLFSVTIFVRLASLDEQYTYILLQLLTLNNQRDYGTESTIFQTEVDDTRRRELGMWSGDLLLVGDAESVHLSTRRIAGADGARWVLAGK